MALDTKNPFIDALGGTAWGRTDSNTTATGRLSISYAFDQDTSAGHSTGGAWLTAEQRAFSAAAQSWEDVANIDLFAVTDTNATNWVERKVTNTELPPPADGGMTLGDHDTPDAGIPVHVGRYNTMSTWDLRPGSLMYNTFVHEIGHALGLAHPHDDLMGTGLFPGVANSIDTGDNDLNQDINTIMSYNRPFGTNFTHGYAATPMAFDIAAIQHLYGAVHNKQQDTVYYLLDSDNNFQGAGFSSIWDTGGTDRIEYFGAKNVTIDLRPATLAVGDPNAGGFISRIDGVLGGFTIAADATNFIGSTATNFGVEIENARGGSGNDTLIGNALRNTLEGGAGNDTLNGGAGADIMDGGGGNDVYVVDDRNDKALDSGTGVDERDAVYTTLNNLRLDDAVKFASIENLHFNGTGAFSGTGNALNNGISGGAGNDRLYGLGGLDHLVGEGGDDQLYGGIGTDHLEGRAGVDTLYGGGDGDSLEGGEGNDTLYGEAGVDTLNGGDDDDALYGGSENDILIGGAGIDVLRGESGEDTIAGGSENDFLFGGSNNDRLFGGTGNDDLQGEAGDDLMVGDSGDDAFRFMGNVASLGNDTIYGGTEFTDALTSRDQLDFALLNSGSRVTVDLKQGTYIATQGTATAVGSFSGIEEVWGTLGNDHITGSDRADWLSGNPGHDVLIGNGGADTLSGGQGNDTFIVDNFDIIKGGADYDTIRADETTVADGFRFSIGTTSIESVFGHNGHDTIDANGVSYAVTFDGRGGNDTLTGGLGNDVIDGGAGRNTLNGGGGHDQLKGNLEYDEMHGGGGNDTLTGSGGQTIMYGDEGNDTLKGSLESHNSMYGGTGNDTYTGGNFTDWMSDHEVNGGDDIMYGGGGNDSMVDHYGYNRMYGEAGDDVIVSASNVGSYLDGGADNDTLTAYFGGNTLIGGAGNDRLTVYEGGDALNILTGGSGSDTFVFQFGVTAWQRETVTDFEDGIDKILIGNHATTGQTFDDLTVTDSAAGAVVSWYGNEMTLTGITASQLSAADFLLA